MMRAFALAAAVFALAAATAAAAPGGNNVVINEIMANPPGTYDGAEYIELYNPTASAINISGWVLTGTEYGSTAGGGGVCGGEDRWQFPSGTWIPAGGYIIVAKDGGDGDDGFYEVYGFYPDFEMYDNQTNFAEFDNPNVPNMVQLDFDSYSDEIQLVGGRGYGRICGATSKADVVYLYTSATLTTLVDLVEYKDATLCASDPCPGDDGSNNNAFPIIPYLGYGLGRSPAGADTDNSNVDFAMQAPTPGEQNVTNTPPWIRSVRYSPIPPSQTLSTAVSAIITDDGTIDSVSVYYRGEGGSWARVPATAAPGDSLYTGQVPPFPNGTMVEYYVRAVDNYGAAMNFPAEGAAGPYRYSIGYTSIYTVQFVPDGGNQSQLVGRPVNVRGIVTGAKGTFSSSYFFIHEGTGAFKGIKIYAPSYTGAINEGDDVTVCGNVLEYFDETEVSLHFSEALVVHSTGNANYGYTTVTTAAVAPTNVISAEKYEGQLIRMQNATVTALPDAYGQWKLRDSSNIEAMVDDAGYYEYVPALGDIITELRGIVFYNYSEYKTNPRKSGDVIGPPSIGTVRYSPVPPTSSSAVTVSADCNDDVGITAATLYYATSEAGPYSSVSMTPARAMYQASIGPFSNGTRIYYYVTATDGQMTARKPTVGSYSFYVGLSTIYNVQYVAGGGDVSPMDGLPINVEGVVTAPPGVFSNYIFFIQDGSGAFNGILVYDRTGSLSFQRGDRVVVCGKVQENFRETEIALHFPEAAVVTASGVAQPAPVDIQSNELQTVTTGEKYEGVLVHVKGATVLDPDIGYGEWMISNGTAADTCRVDDYADYDYVPVLNDDVCVLGIVKFAFGNYKLEPRGNSDIAVNPVGVPDGSLSGRFGLLQNTPNPFNPTTTIRFILPEANEVRLEIYDAAGRKVTTLVDGRMLAGEHQLEWNGMAATGDRVASGVYFYKLTAGEENVSRKMVLLK